MLSACLAANLLINVERVDLYQQRAMLLFLLFEQVSE